MEQLAPDAFIVEFVDEDGNTLALESAGIAATLQFGDNPIYCRFRD